MSRRYLAELSVKDLALVSELRLELHAGLTVLTGETGAGKSILVDALLAATGGRVAAGMVREGAERARVEAVFAGGLDDLVLAREIQPGRAPARLNGETVPLTKLAETGADLVAVHGQGEQLRLARPAVQRDLLDAYGGHERLRAGAASAHRALRGIETVRDARGGDHKRGRDVTPCSPTRSMKSMPRDCAPPKGRSSRSAVRRTACAGCRLRCRNCWSAIAPRRVIAWHSPLASSRPPPRSTRA